MKILLLGSQGSGKSTQAKFLSEDLNIPVISTGDIFRQLAVEDSEDGRKIAEIVKNGGLIDDVTTSEIVKKRLSKPDAANGFILDGYPRSVKQIEYFDPQFDKVLFLKVSKHIAVERLLKRGRIDDYTEAIKKRLEEYYHQIEKILEYYSRVGNVVEINAEQPVDDVTKAIEKLLEEDKLNASKKPV